MSAGDPPAEFMEAVSRIPATWACVGCGREFSNAPLTGEPPVGVQLEEKLHRQSRVVYRRIVGNLCGRCMGTPPDWNA